jgi:hypothetical protein
MAMLRKDEMRDYKSNDEFFQALRDLTHRVEKQGSIGAAQQLREGFSCLNGLTDGWALLMESIDKTISENQGKIEASDMSELKDMLKVVRKVVYRR